MKEKQLRSAHEIALTNAKKASEGSSENSEAGPFRVDALPRRLNYHDTDPLSVAQLVELEKEFLSAIAHSDEAMHKSQKGIDISVLLDASRRVELESLPQFQELQSIERRRRDLRLNYEFVYGERMGRTPIPRVDLSSVYLNSPNPNEISMQHRKEAIAAMSAGSLMQIRPRSPADYKPMRVICGWFNKETGEPERGPQVGYEKQVEEEPDGRFGNNR